MDRPRTQPSVTFEDLDDALWVVWRARPAAYVIGLLYGCVSAPRLVTPRPGTKTGGYQPPQPVSPPPKPPITKRMVDLFFHHSLPRRFGIMSGSGGLDTSERA